MFGMEWSDCRMYPPPLAAFSLRSTSARTLSRSLVASNWASILPTNARRSPNWALSLTTSSPALASSGLLARAIGGPSVHPPQPDGVFQFTQDPKPWDTDQDNDRYRRGMYTQFWRSSPYPSLMVFDFPNSNVTCTRRVRSNTPLQSLTLANDQAFVECARALAQQVLAESPPADEQRVQVAFRRCLARTPTADETRRLVQFVAEQRASFRDDPRAAQELVGAWAEAAGDVLERAAWVATARVLLNLDEFITRE